MANFKIDDEIRDLLPQPADDESLTQLLKTEGCRDGLVLATYPGLATPILADGHRRYRICRQHKIPFRIAKTLKFESRAHLELWIWQNQGSRRNLTDEQRAYALGKRHEIEKKIRGGDRKSEEAKSNRQNDGLIGQTTAERIAEETGTSPSTVERAAKFAKSVDLIGDHDPEERAKILSGQSELSRNEVIAKASEIAATTNGKAKRKKKAPPPRPEFLTHEGKYDSVVKALSNAARSITKAMNESDGEKLIQYLSAFRFVVFSSEIIEDGIKKKKNPKFRGFGGLRRLVKLAAMPGKVKPLDQVKKEYARKDASDEE